MLYRHCGLDPQSSYSRTKPLTVIAGAAQRRPAIFMQQNSTHIVIAGLTRNLFAKQPLRHCRRSTVQTHIVIAGLTHIVIAGLTRNLLTSTLISKSNQLSLYLT